MQRIKDILEPDGWAPSALIGARILPSGDMEIKPIYGGLSGQVLIPRAQIPYPTAFEAALVAANRTWPQAPRHTYLHFSNTEEPGWASSPSALLQVAAGKSCGLENGQPWFAFHPNKYPYEILLARVRKSRLEIQCLDDTWIRYGTKATGAIRWLRPMASVHSFEVPAGSISRMAEDLKSAPRSGYFSIWRRMVHVLRHEINPCLEAKIAFPETITDSDRLYLRNVDQSDFESLVSDALLAFPCPDMWQRCITMTTPRTASDWQDDVETVTDRMIHEPAPDEIDPHARIVIQAILAATTPYGAGPKTGENVMLSLASDWFAAGKFMLFQINERDVTGHEQLLAIRRLIDLLISVDIDPVMKKKALAALGAS